ncbi:hypothetical protein [Nakamurella aerolata]|uniref:Uncharacterized protein n=1 Tax=Nakamurella aerolata TaxID=1656892 RepID=A0A849A6K1_9ACTN|nr:hypothetical protein [Nakamurella aerolata]NNG34651.1 hypothetical protein [Nakamurella aerolata]
MTTAFPDDRDRPDSDLPDDGSTGSDEPGTGASGGHPTEGTAASGGTDGGAADAVQRWSDDDIEREFSAIVAGWEPPAAPAAPTASVVEISEPEVDTGQIGGGEQAEWNQRLRPEPPAWPSQRSAAEARRLRRRMRRAEREAEVAAFEQERARKEAEYAADTEHFVPPPAPPVVWPTIRTTMAILLVVAGIFLLLGPNVLTLSATGTVLLSAALVIGGGVLLLLGLRRHHAEQGDGWDDGSAV